MPHLARALFDWSRGSTFTVPFSITTETSSGTRKLSSPLAPFIFTVWPVTLAVTPDGTATGFLPTRDISVSYVLYSCRAGSEDLAEHFAADVALARLVVGHDALRRRQNGGAEPVGHARHGVDGGVDAPAGLRHPLDGAYDGLAVMVLELDRELGAAVAELGGGIVADIAFRL